MKNKRKLIFDEVGLQAFAAQLKLKRKHLGFTQEELAHASGLTLSQIARIETAAINPTLSTIFKIIRTLNISPAEMFDFQIDNLKS